MSKKFIAIISALALVVTLLAPVGVQEASAASKNKVDRVVTVKADTDLTTSGGVIPTLIIEVDDKATVTGATYNWEAGQTFRLELPSSAEWKFAAAGEEFDAQRGAATVNDAVKVEVLTSQIATVTIQQPLNDGDLIQIPLKAKIKSGASGEQRVTVNPMDSRVTGGSYTFAVAQSGATVATVASKKTITRGTGDGATIIIDETVRNAFTPGDRQNIRLRLPSGFEWHSDTDVTPEGLGIAKGDIGLSDFNERYLDISFTAANSSTRGSIIIEPVITATRDAKYGEVTVDIINRQGQVTAQSGLVIAEYADHNIVVEIDEVKEFLAGKEDPNVEEYTDKIVIKETTANSFLPGRIIELELPSWARVTTDSAIKVSTTNAGALSGTDFKVYSEGSVLELETDDFLPAGPRTSKIELEIELPLTIAGTRSGDIELTVRGGGVEEQTIVIGEAIAPVTAEVNVADVRLGVQGQDAPEIIITENKAGALKEGENLELKFYQDIGFRFDSAKFEVIDGDIELHKDNHGRVSGNKAIYVEIKTESSEPSTIRVYDIKMTVDRTAPEGYVQLDIGGEALVDPANSARKDFPGRVARFDFANVITPAPGEVRGTSVFTIDSTTYTVIESGQEVERTMDVAPYIKDSRTFLPVFFVAQALGVAENNIVWEPHSKTVTIYKGDRIAQMQIGNNVLTVNGTSITMDTAPEIKDGRTMLPIYYVGQALGANVEWDGDARTVTVSQ